MKLTSPSFKNNQPIPKKYAFGATDPVNHISLSDNWNPAFAWTGVPAGTRSLVLICHDPDVPVKPDDVNQEGREVPASLPRVDFYHWILVDLPTTATGIKECEYSNKVTARGKSTAYCPSGVRQGLNNYTDWFAGDKGMEGKYFGYDGPCPPWNDSIIHHYVFTLYALDTEKCPVDGDFGGVEVLSAIEPHILDQASITGTYTLNPRVNLTGMT